MKNLLGEWKRRCLIEVCRDRKGYTMVELLIAISISGMISLIVFLAMSTSTRAALIGGEHVRLRRGLDEVAGVLADVIKGSSVSGDLFAGTDTSMQVNERLGAGTVCQQLNTGELVLPQLQSDVDYSYSGEADYQSSLKTHWIDRPDSNDMIGVYAVVDDVTGKRQWLYFRIARIRSSADKNLCSNTMKSAVPLSVADSLVIVELHGVNNETVAPGVQVRFIRPARYSIYRAADNGWYLGYKRCPPESPCHTIQPVSGPYSHASYPPMALTYTDIYGVERSSHDVVRPLRSIGLQLRSEANRSGRLNGGFIAGARMSDSILIIYSLRNR